MEPSPSPLLLFLLPSVAKVSEDKDLALLESLLLALLPLLLLVLVLLLLLLPLSGEDPDAGILTSVHALPRVAAASWMAEITLARSSSHRPGTKAPPAPKQVG